MNPELEPLWIKYEALYKDTLAALKDLPPEAVNWRPFPSPDEVNSLAGIVCHAYSVEEWWIHGELGRRPVRRSREREFGAMAQDAQELMEYVERVRQITKEVLESMSSGGLLKPAPPLIQEMLESPGAAYSQRVLESHVTVLGIAIYPLYHSGIHLGHMQLTRQLWEEQARG
ncbi:MAG: DinB family protein [Chloroflexi bacterium]|nr:DinB family protein [Chloroflexota bacterium]